jgi:tRNA pseudouridine13 synthase
VPEDFVVDERSLPGVATAGSDGEYVHLRVRKRNLTTAWLVGGLARHFSVPLRDVGHAGLKDRRAVTSQWFSVRAPSGLPLSPWFEPGTAVLEAHPARAALRPGDLAGNGFRLRVRDVDDPAALEAALVALRAAPCVPNYFGAQRFGNGAANLEAVWDWCAGRRAPATRFERGIWLSTARSLLFNLALADRVRMGDWRQSLPGEARVHGAPSGPLWGRGRTLVQRDALARCLETWRGAGPARTLVEREGLRQDLRPWALVVADLDWHWVGRDVVLRFDLPAGGYATTVLRELLRGAALAAEDDDGSLGEAAGAAPSLPPRASGAAR